jgi:hypothetical protein
MLLSVSQPVRDENSSLAIPPSKEGLFSIYKYIKSSPNNLYINANKILHSNEQKSAFIFYKAQY